MSTTLITDGTDATHEDSAERWSAHGMDVARQLESWAEIMAQTHLTLEVSATRRTPAPFVGGVVRRQIGDLMLVDCAAVPFRGRRSEDIINAHAAHEDRLGFQFVHKGVEIVHDKGNEISLTPGSVVMWDGLQTAEIEVMQPFYKRTLLFPRSRVLAVCPRLADLEGLPPLESSGPARLLVRYMNALAAELPTLDPHTVITAANIALELLRTVVEPELPTGRGAERAALRADIRRHVRAHLRDQDLSPTSIAREFAMSIRALHALFEQGDESVAELIRNERLQRCLEDVQQRNGGSITEIAFRWGFCDAAHFSRVFKRRFGATPSEVRHAALTGAAITLDREAS